MKGADGPLFTAYRNAMRYRRKKKPKSRNSWVFFYKFGRSTRIRTLDPLVPNQVRYRAAPHSEDQDNTGRIDFGQGSGETLCKLFTRGTRSPVFSACMKYATLGLQVFPIRHEGDDGNGFQY